MMHRFSWIALFFSVNLFFQFSHANSVLIQEVVGQPAAIRKSTGEKSTIQSGQKKVYDYDFSIQTAADDYIKMTVNEVYELILLGEASIDFDMQIEEKEILVYSITLNKGRVYLKQSGDQLGLKLISGLAQINLPSPNSQFKLDAVIQYLPEKPSIQFCQKQGVFEFSVFDHEIKKILKAGQSVSFAGQLSEGQIQYDLLLEGKKIPQGGWGEISTCDFKEFEDIQARIRDQQKKIQQQAADKKKMAAADKKRKDDQFLCHNPYGQYHDCMWLKSGNNCFRSRCNAQGKWEDRQLVKPKMALDCGSEKPVVKKCDY